MSRRHNNANVLCLSGRSTDAEVLEIDGETVLVETSPAGAMLDLFYVRSNFQKRYEQAEAPARVVLPPRVEAGPRGMIGVGADKMDACQVSPMQRERSERCVPTSPPFPQVKEARVEHIFRYAHVYPRALALMGSLVLVIPDIDR